jgi:hypothetical protein
VSTLQYPVTQIPEEGLDIDETVSGNDLRPDGAKDAPLESVRIRGRLTEVGDAWQFRGSLEGAHSGVSDWTGETVSAPFSVRVEWYFVEGEPADDDELEGTSVEREDGTMTSSHVFNGSTIDLARAAWEEAVLAQPMTMPWQQSTASGLGMDLTKEPYVSGKLQAEEDQRREKAFGKLAELFPEAKPKQE